MANVYTSKMVDGVEVPLTADEIAELQANDAAWEAGAAARLAVIVRTKRNNLIAATDYLMLTDSPHAANESLKAYRQALRDVPQQADLNNVVWPVMPDISVAR